MIRRLIASVVLLSSAALIHPHPHLFMEARYELDMGSSGMRGFWVEWTFDQYFTGSIMMDYDLDRNRRFDEAETLDVEANAFSNLENFNYFTFVAEDGSHRGVTEVLRSLLSARGGTARFRPGRLRSNVLLRPILRRPSRPPLRQPAVAASRGKE
jgi:ABC-type uncharacterized transport system substrate-binding protein